VNIPIFIVLLTTLILSHRADTTSLNALSDAFRGAVRDNLRVQLATLVAASESTAATRKRLEKTAALAGALRAVDSSEIVAAVGFLCGEPRQGRIGVGWATVGALEAQPAERAGLSLSDVDVALTRLSELRGRESSSGESSF
jgi:hypothetical protein